MLVEKGNEVLTQQAHEEMEHSDWFSVRPDLCSAEQTCFVKCQRFEWHIPMRERLEGNGVLHDRIEFLWAPFNNHNGRISKVAKHLTTLAHYVLLPELKRNLGSQTIDKFPSENPLMLLFRGLHA